MSNKRLHIPSGNIGEIEIDSDEFDWFQSGNTESNPDKTIPLFTLVSNLMSLTSRYHTNYARIVRIWKLPRNGKWIYQISY